MNGSQSKVSPALEQTNVFEPVTIWGADTELLPFAYKNVLNVAHCRRRRVLCQFFCPLVCHGLILSVWDVVSAGMRQILAGFLLTHFIFRSSHNPFIWGKYGRLQQRCDRWGGMKGAVGALADLCLAESAFPSCSCQLKGSASSPEMGNQSCKNSPRVSLPTVVEKVGHVVLQGYSRIKRICDTRGACVGKTGVGNLALMITLR